MIYLSIRYKIKNCDIKIFKSKRKMFAGRDLIERVIRSLHMTQDDLKQFVPPKAIYQLYNRQIIYDLNKYQLDLFTTIVDFPKHITTVKDRQKVLIMYLENHPEYQDNNYISIWFRFAEKFQTRMKKVKIIEYEFQRARKANDYEIVMSFANNTRTNDSSDEENDDDYDDEDEAVNYLRSQMKMMKI